MAVIPGAGLISRFFGRTVSEASAFAIGVATGPGLAPLVQDVVNEARSTYRVFPIDVLNAAQLVAEGLYTLEHGDEVAAAHGIAADPFASLVELARRAPSAALVLSMWRRGAISEALVDHSLAKASIEPEYREALKSLFTERLDPAIVADSIQRGTMRDPGLLPVDPPLGGGTVPPMPVSSLDPIEEAAAHGVDRERLAIMTRNVGLPPGPGELLQLLNRGAIEHTDWLRGIAEGNTRMEWADALEHLRRRLLTPHEYAELHLRGWITEPAMLDGATLSGMENADTELLFRLLGRPIPIHQVVTGEARGGVFNGPTDAIPEQFLRSLQQGNERPEWYNLSYANRYTYPSAFFFRLLLTTGVITAAEGEQYFLAIGWPPGLARQVATRLAGGTAPAGDPHVGKAETQLWNTLHTSYIAEETDAGQAQSTLATLGVAAAAVQHVLALWNDEKALIRKRLTSTQIKKAYLEAVQNPATGQPWTHDDASAELVSLGYSLADATTFLEL